jgi:hypothetical protein
VSTEESDGDAIVRRWLDTFEEGGEERWEALQGRLQTQFERQITIEAVLFLVGIQTRGRGFEPKIHRDRKQDIIMDGTFTVFESIGFYRRVGMESDGAWIWERCVTPGPGLTVEEQESLLKVAILEYFAAEGRSN